MYSLKLRIIKQDILPLVFFNNVPCYQCLLQVVSLFLQIRKKTKPTYFAFKIYPDCHSVWNPNFKFYRVLIRLVQFSAIYVTESKQCYI